MGAMTVRRRDTQHHTYGDYLTWPDDQRYELIDGVAYLMAPPAPSPTHQELVGELHYQARTALEGKRYRVYMAPFDIRLPRADEMDDQVDTVVQPDVFIVCDRRKIDGRGMRGAPDWIAEVLSPATASHDQIVKVPIYERAGVPEVWLIHPTDRVLSIYRLAAARYTRPAILEMKGQTSMSAVPGVTIDWDRLLASIDEP